MTISLNKPLSPNLQILNNYLEKVNESGWYTNFGPLHALLTKRLEEYLGVQNLLLVSNGTLAIQVACKTLNINSAITTPFSFVATTSSLLWQGIDTAFSDIDPLSYNLCPIALDSAFCQDSSYDGIVATHVYGNPCDIDSIANIANKHNKKVVYDAAHAFSVKVNGESLLNYGDASTLSFHATKIFHTVEGGAIVFKNKADFDKAKQLINFGMREDGSLGEPVINHRSTLFTTYRNELKGIVEFPRWHEEASLNGAYMPIYIPDMEMQESLIIALKSNNIQSRRYFTPSLDLAYNQQKSFGCGNSQRLACGAICLPLHNFMSINDVLKVTGVIKHILKGKF